MKALEIYMNPFAQSLKEIRNQQDLILSDLSDLSGITIAQISRIESGKSEITLNAIARLAFGLGLSFEELLTTIILSKDEELHIKYLSDICHDLVPQRYQQTRFKKLEPELPIPQPKDLYNFVRLFRASPTEAENILIEGILEVFPDLPKEKAADLIAHAIHPVSEKVIPIAYPRGKASLDEDPFDVIYKAGGELMLSDLAEYVRLTRARYGSSLRKITENRLSHNTLANIEQGLIGRILFSLVIHLDYYLEQDGALLVLAWTVAEYETGIVNSINRSQKERGPIVEWEQAEKAVADTFITICRWRFFQEGEQNWWNQTRQLLDQLPE
ncbi:MAG: helix-turn-helix transcriptional regulator [Chloroflexota bacterium]